MKLHVTVHPNSRKPRIISNKDGTLDIYVSQPATEGKANHAVIAILADYFNTSKSHITLLRGVKLKRKVFEVETET